MSTDYKGSLNSMFQSRPDFHSLDEKKPSRVIVAMGPNGKGAVLDYIGWHVGNEIEEAGVYELDGLGLDDAPRGVTMWEGVYVFVGDEPDGIEARPQGKFRRLTDAEWAAVRHGFPPWNQRDWSREAVPFCAVPGCNVPSASGRPMCDEHWIAVPGPAQIEYFEAVEGAMGTRDPAVAMHDAQVRALLAFRGMT